VWDLLYVEAILVGSVDISIESKIPNLVGYHMSFAHGVLNESRAPHQEFLS